MKELKNREDSYIRRLRQVLNKLDKAAKEINKDLGIYIKPSSLTNDNITLLDFTINYKGYIALVIRMKDYWEDDDVIEFEIVESYSILDYLKDKDDIIIKIFEKVAGFKVEINK